MNNKDIFTGEIKEMLFGNKFSINDVWATNTAYRDTLETDVTWNSKKYESNGSLSLLSHIQGWSKQDITIKPSEIFIGNEYFHIKNESKIYRDSTQIIIEELALMDEIEKDNV